ncbi:Putative cellulose synthase 2 [Frankliniella fusca]|uniref:Cellulose synthase 2 n=1 Tax=Frankliniella fusca TaxID=407009 RepID=A0AAE1HZN0_9NEOP|nr:Putative cellulose synthase 2 [Frankliniella fusca]
MQYNNYVFITGNAVSLGCFKYVEWPEEAFIINALAMVLVGLAILLVYAVRRETFRVRVASIVSQRL